MDTEKINALREIIEASRRIVFFGGAGVSTESGIPDFRSASGLYGGEYAGYPPEEILSAAFFQNNAKLFYEYYFANLVHPDARPNAAHSALADLETAGKVSAVITQNIDGLHQAAGSANVIELHGSVHKNFCVRCRTPHSLAQMLKNSPKIPECEKCGCTVRPGVVLYGEALNGDVVSAAIRHIREADALIIGGTSLSVYPAAGFISYFKGKSLAVINRGDTSVDGLANVVVREPIGEVFLRLSSD
ncbi:MAG: NAD-dependent protein deacylase [Defluviitaleaceae bacterium]|nr:NAD-dependent protein deacylase [Defluviitaleaceae bacterium]